LSRGIGAVLDDFPAVAAGAFEVRVRFHLEIDGLLLIAPTQNQPMRTEDKFPRKIARAL
jgi:hypothetical protein